MSIRMFSFVKFFITRAYIALFSYLSWQVQISQFRRFVELVINIAITFILFNIIV